MRYTTRMLFMRLDVSTMASDALQKFRQLLLHYGHVVGAVRTWGMDAWIEPQFMDDFEYALSRFPVTINYAEYREVEY